MYPNLYYLFKDLFHLDLPALKMIQSFGFFVAVAFLLCAYFFAKELKRKENMGLLRTSHRQVTRGGKAGIMELATSGIIGFIIFYKLVYIISNFSAFTEDTQGFLLSAEGNIIGGLAGAAVSVFLKYREKEQERKKYKLDAPKTFTEIVHPHEHVGNMTIIAAVAGLLGAKLFDIFENFGGFTQDPWGTIFSFSGLTMYGGLILGAAAVIWYARKQGLTITHVIDACAPGLFLAYGVGRIGCHVAGDGDWGILNSAYLSNSAGQVIPATPEEFQAALKLHSNMLSAKFDGLANVPYVSFQGPSFLPDWFYAYSYPHNVLNDGVELANCTDRYCSYLPLPVFPTPLYEAILNILFFAIIWSVRKRFIVPGVLFSVYLMMNGLERFFVEKIRVNKPYELLGMHITQAEIISAILFLLGLIGIWYFKKKYTPPTLPPTTSHEVTGTTV